MDDKKMYFSIVSIVIIVAIFSLVVNLLGNRLEGASPRIDIPKEGQALGLGAIPCDEATEAGNKTCMVGADGIGAVVECRLNERGKWRWKKYLKCSDPDFPRCGLLEGGYACLPEEEEIDFIDDLEFIQILGYQIKTNDVYATMDGGAVILAGAKTIQNPEIIGQMLIKLDRNMDVTWNTFYSCEFPFLGGEVVELSDGDFIVFEGNPKVRRFSSEGTLKWTRNLKRSLGVVYDLELMSDGNLIGSESSDSDNYVFSLSPDGDIKWIEKYRAVNSQHSLDQLCRTLESDDGRIYAVGFKEAKLPIVFALNSKKKKIFSAPIGDFVSGDHCRVHMMQDREGNLLIGGYGFMYKIDSSNGALLQDFDSSAPAGIFQVSDNEYIYLHSYWVRALSTDGNQERDIRITDTFIMQHSIILNDGRLLVLGNVDGIINLIAQPGEHSIGFFIVPASELIEES